MSQKAGGSSKKHGRNKVKCARYYAESRLDKSRVRRAAKFDAMVEESRERRAAHGPYAGERRRAARYAAYLKAKAGQPEAA